MSTTVVAHPVPWDLIFEIESSVSLQSCSIRTFFMANIKSEERERETERPPSAEGKASVQIFRHVL